MKAARRTVLVAAVLSSLLSACVTTRVTGRSVGQSTQPAQQLLIVVVGGQFSRENVAESLLAQRNFDRLIPYLVDRLPAVFSRNGVSSRGVFASSTVGAIPGLLRPAAGERLLIVAPQSAIYDSQGRQGLYLSVKLLSEPPASTIIWQGQVRLAMVGSFKFDAKVANDIAVQILEELRSAKLATVKEGPLQFE